MLAQNTLNSGLTEQSEICITSKMNEPTCNLEMDVVEDPVSPFTVAHMESAYEAVDSNDFIKKRLVKQGSGIFPEVGVMAHIKYQLFVFGKDGDLVYLPPPAQKQDADGKNNEPMDQASLGTTAYQLMIGRRRGNMDLAVSTMSAGEVSYFYVKRKNWGALGKHQVAESDLPVVLYIEVTAFMEPTEVDNIVWGLTEDKNGVRLEHMYQAATTLRIIGNANYDKRQWFSALRCYKAAYFWASSNSVDNEKDYIQFNNLVFGICSSLAGCYIMLQQYSSAIYFCVKGLEIPYQISKLYGECPSQLYYRLAKAQYELQQYESALNTIEQAAGLDPEDSAIEILRFTIFEKVHEKCDLAYKTWKVDHC